jgi:hypothetical protein
VSVHILNPAARLQCKYQWKTLIETGFASYKRLPGFLFAPNHATI